MHALGQLILHLVRNLPRGLQLGSLWSLSHHIHHHTTGQLHWSSQRNLDGIPDGICAVWLDGEPVVFPCSAGTASCRYVEAQHACGLLRTKSAQLCSKISAYSKKGCLFSVHDGPKLAALA